MLRLILTAALTLATPAALHAQETGTPQQTAAQMLEVQQVTALAQQQFAGMVAGNIGSGFQGAIALPGDTPGTWLALIIARRSDAPDADYIALAEYEIVDGAIISEVIHLPADAPAIDGVPSAMAQARTFAPRAVLATGTPLCVSEDAGNSVNLTTIVLPPREDGGFDAYVLNGPIEPGAVPLGKHWRVGFDAFGLDGEPELLTDTCEVVTWDESAGDPAGSTYIAEHGGAAPTAVHYFLSPLLPMTLTVNAGGSAWRIVDGALQSSTSAGPAPVTGAP